MLGTLLYLLDSKERRIKCVLAIRIQMQKFYFYPLTLCISPPGLFLRATFLCCASSEIHSSSVFTLNRGAFETVGTPNIADTRRKVLSKHSIPLFNVLPPPMARYLFLCLTQIRVEYQTHIRLT